MYATEKARDDLSALFLGTFPAQNRMQKYGKETLIYAVPSSRHPVLDGCWLITLSAEEN